MGAPVPWKNAINKSRIKTIHLFRNIQSTDRKTLLTSPEIRKFHKKQIVEQFRDIILVVLFYAGRSSSSHWKMLSGSCKAVFFLVLQGSTLYISASTQERLYFQVESTSYTMIYEVKDKRTVLLRKCFQFHKKIATIIIYFLVGRLLSQVIQAHFP